MKIHLNTLPTRIPNRIKYKFRNMIQNPNKMDLDLKMMLMRGNVDTSLINCPDIQDQPHIVPSYSLVRYKDNHPFALPWIESTRHHRCWKLFRINYDVIKDAKIRSQMYDEALIASQKGLSLLIPYECLVDRNDALNTRVYPGPTDLQIENFFEPFDVPSSSTNETKSSSSILEHAYNNMARFCAIRVTTDSMSLSTYMSRLILDLHKEYSADIELHKKLVNELFEIQAIDPSKVLNKLIDHSKNYPDLLRILTYIFGIKDPSTSYRFWLELAQLCKNLQEIQIALGFNSHHHRRFLLFLSQLSNIKFQQMDIRELQKLLPISEKTFKSIHFTHNEAVPSIFNMLQNFGDNCYKELELESIISMPFNSTDTMQHLSYDPAFGGIIDLDEVKNNAKTGINSHIRIIEDHVPVTAGTDVMEQPIQQGE